MSGRPVTRRKPAGPSGAPAGLITLFLLAGALGASGCSSMNAFSDFDPATDFGTYKTWDWMPEPEKPNPDPRLSDAVVRGQFQSAVADELLRRGYKNALSNPDFLFAYHLSLETKLRMEVVNEYYGYDYHGNYGSTWGAEPQGQAALPGDYEQGTLLLDILDAKTKVLVWRGTVEAEVYPGLEPSKREERIREAVKKGLSSFPPR